MEVQVKVEPIRKTCTKCGKKKSKKKFYNSKSNKDGLYYWCRKCVLEVRKEYYRTKSGLITHVYATQKRSSKIRGDSPPEYTKEEFLEWLISQKKFHKLYNNWVKSGYEKNLSPSVDRLNDYKGYSFDNIQVLTWQENMAKGHKDAKEGVNNKQNKIVLQFTKDGEFVSQYHSGMEAERQTGINNGYISNVCLGKLKCAGGFLWKHKKR